MSWCIDMKIIRSSNFSCRIVLYSIFLWISRSDCSIVCLGFFLHANTARSPSIRSNSRYSEECVNHSMLPLQDSIDRGYSAIFQRQSSESEKTYTFAVDSSTASSFNKVVIIHGIVFHSIVDIPYVFLDSDPGSVSVKYRTIV